MWLTSLILFPHSDAFQIDLHTAKCPLSLGLAVVGAVKCTKPERDARQREREADIVLEGWTQFELRN